MINDNVKRLIEENTKSWYDAALIRTSKRDFNDAVFEKDKEDLKKLCEEISGDGMRFVIIEDASKIIKGLTARNFSNVSDIVVFLKKEGVSSADLAYRGKMFVLECTKRGVGTCWVAGTYDRGALSKRLLKDDDESVLAITPIGMPTEPLVSEPKRKRKALMDMLSLESNDFVLAPWQKSALELARIAPSAINQQKWMFKAGEGFIDISMNRLSIVPYEMALLDMGIACLHMELGARSAGEYPKWIQTEKGQRIYVDNKNN